jgi:hypothetical protein
VVIAFQFVKLGLGRQVSIICVHQAALESPNSHLFIFLMPQHEYDELHSAAIHIFQIVLFVVLYLCVIFDKTELLLMT